MLNMKIIKSILCYLMLLFITQELLAQASLADTVIVYDSVTYQDYTVVFETVYLKENIYPNYDTVNHPAALHQVITFKKGNKILNCVIPPPLRFYHTTKKGKLVTIIEAPYKRIGVIKIREQYFFKIYAGVCNGLACPDVDLYYTLEGELYLLNYRTETQSFIYESKGYKITDFNGYEYIKRWAIKPYDKGY
jgi:hypothetical protein